ncbi:MAG: metal ABC transporter ATP-binding protein [Candidatus Magasanikbacteria bacterium]|jgi:zinc transport system ATP-binding protein|nr:metal ABC transporter ATP-binding protein [Candidatus Magasanikbacteria bacterium]MBT4071319.1 metal ABC transporter ATP-binding protein [Candidatus Magasanikbacteria bacterium]
MNAITVKHVSFSYDDLLILDDISFQITPGEIIAIIGPNGSGKTTLIKQILGLLSPDKGSITLFDKAPKKQRTKIGYVPQRFEFDRTTPITIYEFLKLEQCGNKHHAISKIDTFLELVGLNTHKHARLSSLSGGQFQRAMIARALLHEKKILIFDEPSTGIDIAGEKTIYDLIEKINKERDVTCIIVSHELNIVTKYAHRVICINKKLVCMGIPEQVITQDTLSSLYGKHTGLYHSHT